jgi:hypothetical protein
MKINFLPVLQMALIEACQGSTSLKNPGGSCDKMLGPSKGLLVGPTDLVIPSGTTDIVAYMKQQIHAAVGSRVYVIANFMYPLINMIVNAAQPVTETSDYTGEIIFIRSGTENRTYKTTHGGLCLAKAWATFRNSGLGFMDIDGAGFYAGYKNSDASYGFISALNMGGSGFDTATGNTVFKNNFGLSYDPDQYINATVFDGGYGLLSLKNLEDVDVLAGSQTQTTTNIFVKVKTECGGRDVVALVGSGLAQITNFIVKKVSDGSTITITAAAIIGGEVRLTGTFLSGSSYTVALAPTTTLYTNSVFYYEGQLIATVAIP